jgi:hypothetical protein
MELDYLKTLPLGGFNYDNCIRNRAMTESGIAQAPKAMKTGTTICGIIFKVSYIRLQHMNALFSLDKDLTMMIGWNLLSSRYKSNWRLNSRRQKLREDT